MQNHTSDEIPPLPEPWGKEQPENQQGPDQASSSAAPSSAGCGKPAAIGCGCLALVVGLLLILGLLFSQRVVGWFFQLSEEAIVEALPEDVTDAERQELIESFDRFERGLADKSLRTEGLTRLQRDLTNAYGRAIDGSLERVDVQRLITAFSAVAPADGESKSAEPLSPENPTLRELPIA